MFTLEPQVFFILWLRVYTFCHLSLFYHPLALATTFLLSVSLSLTFFFFQFYIHKNIMQYLSFFFWLISFSMMPSGFIHVVTNGRVSFFLMPEWNSILYIHHITFYPFIPWQKLRFFHILAIVNNALVNLGMEMSLQYPVFITFGYLPRRGIAGS